MIFRKYLLFFPVVLILSACGYAVESSNQDITFLTPDAQDAKCYVYIDKLKYQVFPPQKLNIKKSYNDMEITCNAPGNRKVEISVPAKFTKRALWGGPVGVAWDYASSTSHYYPSVIAIDFSHEELKPNLLPQHNNSDIRQPETYDLEEFKPSQPRLNSDKNKVDLPILRKGEKFPEAYIEGEVSDAVSQNSDDSSDEEKGALQTILKALTQQGVEKEISTMPKFSDNNDKTGQGDDASSEPVQIYPGK